jgi:hypothetical protein
VTVTDQLTSTVLDSLEHIATRRGELDQAVIDAGEQLDHLDELEAWLNAYPKLPGGGQETPADQKPEPAAAEAGRGDGPAAARTGARASSPASPGRSQGSPPPRVTAPPRTQGVRDTDAKVLSAAITSNRPLAKAELAEHSGVKGEQLNGAIRRLVQSGQLIATGATRSRRYNSSKDHAPHSERGRKMKAATEASAKRLDDNVKRLGLRERVLKAIAADPGQLSQSRLGHALDAHPDDIAEAVGALIDRNKIEWVPATDCYRRVGQAEVG